MSGDMFGCHSWECATDITWVEAKGAAKVQDSPEPHPPPRPPPRTTQPKTSVMLKWTSSALTFRSGSSSHSGGGEKDQPARHSGLGQVTTASGDVMEKSRLSCLGTTSSHPLALCLRSAPLKTSSLWPVSPAGQRKSSRVTVRNLCKAPGQHLEHSGQATN